MISRRRLIACTAAVACLPATAFAAAPKFNLKGIAEKERVPALGVAVVTSKVMKHLEVAGRRSINGVEPVKTTDSWHLGDNTMGVTSAVFARLVEGGKASWGAKLATLTTKFSLHEAWKDATVESLLAHRSGLDDTAVITDDWLSQRYADPRPVSLQRVDIAVSVLARAPDLRVGEFRPARLNYLVAAAVMEQLSGQAFEDLAKGEAFDWWGATEAGFGAPLGDAPLGHRRTADDRLEPVAAGRLADYPPLMSPATGMHAPLSDYARFLQLFLTDGGGWLRPQSLSRLARPWDHSAAGYGLGWRFQTMPSGPRGRP